MLKDIYRPPVIRDKDWIMPFGKYKGESLADLIDAVPDYVIWLQENTDLDFHSDIIDECEQVEPDGELWHRIHHGDDY